MIRIRRAGEQSGEALTVADAAPDAAGGKVAGLLSGRTLADIAAAAVSAVLAVLVMSGVAAIGLRLLGAGALGSLISMAAAVVALSVGSSVEFTGGIAPSGGLDGLDGLDRISGLGGLDRIGGLEGAVHAMPLGVTFSGAVVLAAALLLPLRRRPAMRALAVRVATIAVVFPVSLVLLVRAASGSITIDKSVVDRMPAGGLTIDFHTDVLPALAGGLGLVLMVVVMCWLASGRTPTPPARLPAVIKRAARPAAVVVVVTLSVLMLIATMIGIAAALAGCCSTSRRDNARIAGAALLAGPNVVSAAIPAGAGVPFAVRTGQVPFVDGTDRGPFATGTGAGWRYPKAADRAGSSLPKLAAPGTPGRLPLAMITATTLIACGVLVARRTRDPGTWHYRAVRNAGRLAAAWAVAMPLLALLTHASAEIGVSILGFRITVASVGVHGDAAVAIALGAVVGAACGAIGSLVSTTGTAVGRAVRGGGRKVRRPGLPPTTVGASK